MAVPAGVVTPIGPVEAVAGTTAPIIVLFVTTKLVAGAPPIVTAEAFVKFTPVILTVDPGRLLVGVKLVMLAGK